MALKLGCDSVPGAEAVSVHRYRLYSAPYEQAGRVSIDKQIATATGASARPVDIDESSPHSRQTSCSEAITDNTSISRQALLALRPRPAPYALLRHTTVGFRLQG